MNAPTFVGVDIGGTTINVVRIARDGKVEHHRTEPTPAVILELLEAAMSLASAARDDASRVLGVGIAGLVTVSGVFVGGPNLPGTDIDIVAAGSPLGLPVVVDNDANCAGYAELTVGSARGVSEAVVLTLGTGIGTAIITSGEVMRGSRGFAGEAGHMVLEPTGPICTCGSNGCFEALVSGRVLDARARDIMGRGATASDLASAAVGGDETAMAAFDAAGDWLGRGVANVAALLDPEIVVIAGGPAAAGDLLFGSARKRIASMSISGADPVPLVGSMMSGQAGAIGAALMARDRYGSI